MFLGLRQASEIQSDPKSNQIHRVSFVHRNDSLRATLSLRPKLLEASQLACYFLLNSFETFASVGP